MKIPLHPYIFQTAAVVIIENLKQLDILQGKVIPGLKQQPYAEGTEYWPTIKYGMNYDQIVKATQDLTYREKLAIAQLLNQTARKEEEESKLAKREPLAAAIPSQPEPLHHTV